MKKEFPGYKDVRVFGVEYNGSVYIVHVGTVSEGLLKGEVGTFAIEGRPCWRWPEPMCGQLQDEGVALYKRPFSIFYDREIPFAFRILDAKMPLVRAHQPYHEMREEFVQSARTVKHPELYLDGVSLAAMGGEPFANWN